MRIFIGQKASLNVEVEIESNLSSVKMKFLEFRFKNEVEGNESSRLRSRLINEIERFECLG